MRVNESLSSSGDYIKGIDFQQVFGIFDPEQGLYFNKREGSWRWLDPAKTGH